jgi:hypothetical protein
LLNSNRFSVLEVTESEIDEDAQSIPEALPLSPAPLCQPRHPKWEKLISQKLVIR